MVKVRWVIVVSPRSRGRGGICTVVPLSTTPPLVIRPYHVKLDRDPWPKGKPGVEVWVKCDMVMAVSFGRLTAYWDGKIDGKRNYVKLMISNEELRKIKKALLHSFGLGHLWPE